VIFIADHVTAITEQFGDIVDEMEHQLYKQLTAAIGEKVIFCN
jgi:hypothetical protein